MAPTMNAKRERSALKTPNQLLALLSSNPKSFVSHSERTDMNE